MRNLLLKENHVEEEGVLLTYTKYSLMLTSLIYMCLRCGSHQFMPPHFSRYQWTKGCVHTKREMFRILWFTINLYFPRIIWGLIPVLICGFTNPNHVYYFSSFHQVLTRNRFCFFWTFRFLKSIAYERKRSLLWEKAVVCEILWYRSYWVT